MNLDIIYQSGLGLVVATVMLVIVASMVIFAILAFVTTMRREHAYATTALPDLEVPEEFQAEVLPDDDMENLEESAFATSDQEVTVLDDDDSNKLMADIDRAQRLTEKAAAEKASKGEKTSMFGKLFKMKKKH